MTITVREARLGDAGAIARVDVETWQKAYQGILPADVLALLSHEQESTRWVRRLETAAAQGVGRRLLNTVAVHLAQAGLPAMLLWVMADNHLARHFYESLGGQLVYTRPRPVRHLGITRAYAAYLWPDTSSLRL